MIFLFMVSGEINVPLGTDILYFLRREGVKIIMEIPCQMFNLIAML